MIKTHSDRAAIKICLFIAIMTILFSAPRTIAQQFTEQTSASITPVYDGSAVWGDYDNDGYLDILMTTYIDTIPETKVFKNNGDGSFTEQKSIKLAGIRGGSVNWMDYNNDGYLDIMLSGYINDYGDYVTKIYKNNGDGSFSELPSVPFSDIRISSSDWRDFDNDGDQDLLITGEQGVFPDNTPVSKIFRNNGDGTFSEVKTAQLTGVQYGDGKWGDYNNDGYPDILLTGSIGYSTPKTVIYKNNGDGTFTEQTSIKLINLQYSNISWGDYDNDGYPDILLSGLAGINPSYTIVSKIYRNNGNGTFSDQTPANLTGVEHSTPCWGDYDNDGKLDILLTGMMPSPDDYSIPISKVYKNNGNGTFSEQTSIKLEGVEFGSAAWGDYDNDGSLDILLTGATRVDSNYIAISKIYKNNNSVKNTKPAAPANLAASVVENKVTLSWNKSTDNETPQNGLNYNLVIGTSPGGINTISPMSDRSTGFRRVVSLGNSQSNSLTIKDLPGGTYYWSVQAIDGSFAGSQFASERSFTVIPSVLKLTSPNGGENWLSGTKHNITWTSSNVNSLIIQYSSDNGATWNIINSNLPADSGKYSWTVPSAASNQCRIRLTSYLNPNVSDMSDTSFTISGQFEQASVLLPGLYSSSAAWGDYDNDGDLDLILTGSTGSGNVSKIYRNNGDGSFSELTSVSLPGVHNGSAAWGDYDNDGYLDLLLTGGTNGNPISKIFRNDGNGSFTELTTAKLTGVMQGSAAWGDFDNDGKLDILLTGATSNSPYNPVSKIYRNNGDGTFSEQTSAGLVNVFNSSAAWGDYDNDGDADILITGFTGSANVTKLYKNNGDGTFSEQTSVFLAGAANGSVEWGDYNNDGYLDILLSGYSGSTPVTKIYRNNGNGTFGELTSTWLTGTYLGSASWGDYDNDGYLDIVMTGSDYNSNVSKIFRNNGNGTFSDLISIQFPGVYYGAAVWGDYDNDGDLDLILTGGGNYNAVSKIYKNNSNLNITNTTPQAPINLAAAVEGNKVTFSWDKSTDNQTPQNGLSYNLVIGTTPGAVNKLSPMSDSLTGFRRIVRTGSSRTNTSAFCYLPGGTYYWSVQAIDGAFAGSKFAPVKSFTVSSTKITVTSPNGGENWLSGSKHNITWTTNNTSYIKIDCSTDNGTNWSPVLASIPAGTGSYLWTVPGTPSNQCRIRISDVTNTYDVSDSAFTIVGQFVSSPVDMTGVWNGSAAWGDYDNDGDLDVLLTGAAGNSPDYKPVSRICRNNGDGTFTEESSISLKGVYLSSAAWGDYDNDGNLDILLTGATEGRYANCLPVTKIYRNTGDGHFTEMISDTLPGFYSGSAAWGDYNNDGYQDILLTGMTGTYPNFYPASKIFRNNKNGTFTEQTNISLTGVAYGTAVWGDYDNDGYPDILLTGYTGKGEVTALYRNNGNGTFGEQVNGESIPFKNLYESSAAWGDYDNDGHLDILLIGNSIEGPAGKIYRNNGDGTFSEQTSVLLTGLFNGSAAWGDYDNDGYLDVFISGTDKNYNPVTNIYRNTGDGKFSEMTSVNLPSVKNVSMNLGDYDNDGAIDILLTGYSSNINNPVTRIYRNNSFILNTPPNAPANLNAAVNGNNVTFSWDKSSDKQTPQNGLNYNLVIGTTPGGVNTLSPLADTLTGFRRVVNFGNSHANKYVMNGLPKGTYYWSVQAIDGSFAGSLFAPVKSFMIQQTGTDDKNKSIVTEYSLSQNYPNPFNPVTVIKYGLPAESSVKVVVYNVLGEKVKELVNAIQSQGIHEISFEAGNYSSGVYYYSIEARSADGSKEYKEIKKMVVLK